jgi:type I restriction enzyme R subunit
VHNQALADIISIVKRAARADEPIYTAVEGIERAIGSVMVGKSFNEEQLKWLGYIQEHLVQNLTIEMNDF